MNIFLHLYFHILFNPIIPCCCCSVAKALLTLCNPHGLTCQASLTMGFAMHKYWSQLPFPSPGDLPRPVSGIEPESLALAGGYFITESPEKLAVVHFNRGR